MKKILAIVLAALMLVACFAGCTSEPTNTPATPDASNTDAPAGDEIPAVNLVLWGSELPEYQTVLRKLADDFIAANADKANITIEIGAESESTAKDTILADIEAAADVFYFADDQTTALVNAGALQPVHDVELVEAGSGEGALAAARVEGTLYAYPAMGGNGYFMYYNTQYLTAEDVKSLDKILEVAAQNGKKFTMDLDNGWYNYAFFAGAGFTTSADTSGNTTCDWNAEGGVAVVEAMAAMAGHEGFIDLNDGEFVTAATDGTVIAGINGSWNSASIQAAFGDGYATAKLPEYTLAGVPTQMGSFDGYKFVGVNAYSENVGWAMELAKYLTSAESQTYFFAEAGAIPANKEAAASDAVLADPVSAALAEQSIYAVAQSTSVGNNFWTPAETLGAILSQGNPDGLDYQELLDTTVAGITAPVA